MDFNVYSNNRDCAAADIVKSDNKTVWGVLWEIPDNLLCRETVPDGKKSFDEIEGEGINYQRFWLPVKRQNGDIVIALTYIVREPKKYPSIDYIKLIIQGLREHKVPNRYINELKQIVIKKNPSFKNKIKKF